MYATIVIKTISNLVLLFFSSLFLKSIELTISVAGEETEEMNQKTKATSGEKRKAPSGEIKDGQPNAKKKAPAGITPRKSVKAGKVERAMESFMEYQQQADQLFLNQMKEQRELDAQLRREEIMAQKESSEVFARLISEALLLTRQTNVAHPPQGRVSQFQDLTYFEL